MKLDPVLLAAMQGPTWRQEARKRVVAATFPPEEQVALYAALGMPVPSSGELSEVREDVLTYKSQLSRGRDARFKVSMISGYHFTCALTGCRLIASKSTYMPIEAAHIHAHARKGPDSPDNGLALTPTAHDLFDAGLWTVDDRLRIKVAHSDIAESILPGGSHFKLSDLQAARSPSPRKPPSAPTLDTSPGIGRRCLGGHKALSAFREQMISGDYALDPDAILIDYLRRGARLGWICVSLTSLLMPSLRSASGSSLGRLGARARQRRRDAWIVWSILCLALLPLWQKGLRQQSMSA